MPDLVVHVRCTYCHDGIPRGGAVHCASCLAPHHADCQAAHGRCAAPGCGDRRVLVPDPRGPEAVPRPGGVAAKPALPSRHRRRRRALAAAGALLVAAGAWQRAPGPPTPAPVGAVQPAPPPPGALPPRPIAASPPVAAPPLAQERAAADVAIVARDLRLPVTLARGERLVVRATDGGYTRVAREPAPGSLEDPTDVLVAEPGDPIDVVVGPGQRLRARPGEAVVVEAAAGGRVRVTVTPAP